MGIAGAGKTRLAEDYVARGYRRLNRDERAGSLRDLADALDAELAAGERRVVLDNTYVTRSARSYVVDAAAPARRPGALRLARHAARAGPGQRRRAAARPLRRRCRRPRSCARLARERPGILAPTSQMRLLRELEPPTEDEGFAARRARGVPCVRRRRRTRSGVFVAAAAVDGEGWEGLDPGAPHLVFDWRPDADAGCAGGGGRSASSAAVVGPGRDRGLPARRRPAALLVPSAAARPAARLRAGARRRPGAFRARRRPPRRPNARRRPGRAHRPGLTPSA